ncbi:hypothetical protein BLOT_001458 [Blomia tropicalis]|nr:hypothetical protein BLOT_001458 [Blomia tropicalis]
MENRPLTNDQIRSVTKLLADSAKPMGERFRALFTLKNIGGHDSIDHIGNVLLCDESALLKHECAYCLGQMQDEHAINVLEKVLSNVNEHPMVRHEAGEALGAIGSDHCLSILEKYLNDPCKDVSETVLLAINRIKHLKQLTLPDGSSSVYSSVDPAPPLEENNLNQNIKQLRTILIDEKESLFKRYQAMFTLRNMNTDESALALADGLDCPDSALFRHEIAFVLGQMQKAITTEKLSKVLALRNENEMVRHECAEALGAIATDEANAILKKYLFDEQRVVRESAIVALDVSDYNNSEQFQLLDSGTI